MERVTGHLYLQEMLGAYALDAVDPEEAAEVERHLETCPRCRDELAGHREVVALLGSAGGAAPSGVWDRIISSLEETPPALRMPPRGVRPAASPTDPPGPRPGDQERLASIVSMEGRRKISTPSRLFLAVATAAAVIMAGLGIEVGRMQVHKTPAPSQQAIQSMMYQVADSSPLARHVTLTSADTKRTVRAAVLPDGTSVLGRGDLPVLPKNETYQLWGIVGAQQVSLRVVGATADYAVFTTPPNVSVLAMTVEQQGGVVTTTKVPEVSGLVPTTA